MNKNSLWKIDRQGLLRFPGKEKLQKNRYKAETLWTHPKFLLAVLIICAVVDFVCFYQLFASFLYDNFWIKILSILGMLLGFDLIPIYLGQNIKKKIQRYNVRRFMIIGMISVFVLAFIINVILRMAFKDLVLPDLTSASTSIFGEAAESVTTSSRAFPYAIFASILPLITSIGSLFISCTMANPLKEELKKLDKEYAFLSDNIGQIESILMEYESDNNFFDRLMEDDEAKYKYAERMILIKQEGYRDYVRQSIKEYIGDPAASSALSGNKKGVLLSMNSDIA